MAQPRRKFDDDFKRNALALIESGRTTASVAAELEIAVELLYRWRKAYAVAELPGQKTVKELETENRKLRKRAERAEAEAAILKKAALIFGNGTTRG